jgi:hypothetical protein
MAAYRPEAPEAAVVHRAKAELKALRDEARVKR